MSQSAAKPTTAEQIVDLIRAEHPRFISGHAISTGEAIDLIEQYAAVAAAEVAIKATSESYDKCLAITDEAMSRPLVAPADRTV